MTETPTTVELRAVLGKVRSTAIDLTTGRVGAGGVGSIRLQRLAALVAELSRVVGHETHPAEVTQYRASPR